MNGNPSTSGHSTGQILLGLFIAWQLFYVLIANLSAEFQVDSPERLASVPVDSTAGRLMVPVLTVVQCWGDLAAQWQGWIMFGNVAYQSGFLELELRWPDRVERLGSAFEPEHPADYFHPLGQSSRLFSYEMRLYVPWLCWNEHLFARNPDPWRQWTVWVLRREWKRLEAYLHWRLARFEREHSDIPLPDEVVLLVRLYRPSVPGNTSSTPEGPIQLPMLRWQPGASVPPGFLPLEVYDPGSKRFQRVHVHD